MQDVDIFYNDEKIKLIEYDTYDGTTINTDNNHLFIPNFYGYMNMVDYLVDELSSEEQDESKELYFFGEYYYY